MSFVVFVCCFSFCVFVLLFLVVIYFIVFPPERFFQLSQHVLRVINLTFEVQVEIVPPQYEGRFAHRVGQVLDLVLLRARRSTAVQYCCGISLLYVWQCTRGKTTAAIYTCISLT